MKNVLIILFALVFYSCQAKTETPKARKDFHVSLFSLGAANKAKQMCSCLFVMKRDRKFCEKFSVPDKYLDWVDQVSIDETAKTINASVAIFWKGTAKYINEKHGCQLQGQ